MVDLVLVLYSIISGSFEYNLIFGFYDRDLTLSGFRSFDSLYFSNF